MLRFIKIIIFSITMLNICVFSSYLYAQVEDSSIKFTDTSQQLLENARKEVLSDKNLSKRRIITKRISGQCDPNKNNLPPECKKENFIKNQKKNLISNNTTEISGKPVNSNNNIFDNANLSRSANQVGGLSTGGATLGITTLILVTGAAILTILSIGGYGDDDSNGVAGSGGSSSTAASAN